MAKSLGRWTLSEWREFYDERAAIMEFDGEKSRAEAEALAREACVEELLGQDRGADVVKAREYFGRWLAAAGERADGDEAGGGRDEGIFHG